MASNISSSIKTSISPKKRSHSSKPQMAIRAHLISPKLLQQPHKFQTHPFPSTPPLLFFTTKTKTLIISSSCTKRISDDAELSSDLATEVSRIKTQMEDREEAMKKSSEILFTELCQHLGLRAEEVKNKWRKMDEEERSILVKGFVSEWGVNFHPLSAKSAKEMVEEHLGDDEEEEEEEEEEDHPSLESSSSSQSMLLSGLKGIMGFSPNK